MPRILLIVPRILYLVIRIICADPGASARLKAQIAIRAPRTIHTAHELPVRLPEIASPNRLAPDTFAENFRGLGQGESWQEMQLVNNARNVSSSAV